LTLQEIEAKELQLKSEMVAALEETKGKKPASAEFDAAYGKYLTAKANLAKIPAELTKAKTEANSGALLTVGATVSDAITQLIVGLKVAELLGEPVKVVRYSIGDDGKPSVRFNTTASTPKVKGERKVGNGHTQIVAPDGTKQSLTKFVLAHATDAEKASKEYKYPHTQADSKPKFDAFCASHNLTGFLYETPEAS
jgi:hypothetical protein